MTPRPYHRKKILAKLRRRKIDETRAHFRRLIKHFGGNKKITFNRNYKRK